MKLPSKSQKRGSLIPLPSEDTSFLFGVNHWDVKDYTKNSAENPNAESLGCLEIPHQIIKVTLHQCKFTIPIVPLGFVVQIQEGGIIRGYDWSITDFSKLEERPSYRTLGKKTREYKEDELDQLRKNTVKNCCNEIWVHGKMASVVGAYIYKNKRSRGRSIFQYYMSKLKVPICILD